MPYPNEVAARINQPDRYVKFARQNNKFGEGIDVIFGITEDGKSEVQAIRFNAAKFTPKQAREWLKEHNYSSIEVEAATGKKCLNCQYFNLNACELYKQLIEQDSKCFMYMPEFDYNKKT